MILVYSPHISTRIRYIFKHILTAILGLDVDFTESVESFILHKGPKFSYAKERLGNELFFEAHGLLTEKGIREDLEIQVDYYNETPYFFELNNPESRSKYDLFACCFYLLSRYEEYLPSMLDKLGRYKALNSLAYQYGFLKTPVVDLWANEILSILQESFSDIHSKKRPFATINSINVHRAYKYKYRGLFASILRLSYHFLRLEWHTVITQVQILLDLKKDPYDTFDFLIQVHRMKKLKSIFFFSIGENSYYDNNIMGNQKKYRELIKSIEDYAFVGLNYSYKSTENPQLKKEEKRLFEEICNRLPNRVRQHLFKLNFPDTYREIYENDILKDFSMGYPDEIGFRAGTCTPFLFYDLKYETLTLLKIFPFIFTDKVLLAKYKKDHKKIKQEVMSLVMTVKAYNGVFISIFHNDTFSNEPQWQGWKEIYLDYLDTITTIQNE